MRIEEMRIPSELRSRRVEMLPAPTQQDKQELVEDNVLTLHLLGEAASDQACELNAAIWSVVCFDGMEAGGLTYLQATRLMSELDAAGVPGLCIVTDLAARRTA